MKKKSCLIISLLFLSLLFIPCVFAADNSAMGVIENVFDAIIGKNFNLADFYNNYAQVIDFIIYLLIFISIANLTLAKRFGENNAAKTLTVTIGVALALSLSIWGKFSIVDLGPLVGTIIVFLFFLAVYNLVKMIAGKGIASSAEAIVIAIVISWYTASAISPFAVQWIESIPMVGPIVKAAISICVLLFVIIVIKLVIGLFSGAGVGRGLSKGANILEEKGGFPGLRDKAKEQFDKKILGNLGKLGNLAQDEEEFAMKECKALEEVKSLLNSNDISNVVKAAEHSRYFRRIMARSSRPMRRARKIITFLQREGVDPLTLKKKDDELVVAHNSLLGLLEDQYPLNAKQLLNQINKEHTGLKNPKCKNFYNNYIKELNKIIDESIKWAKSLAAITRELEELAKQHKI